MITNCLSVTAHLILLDVLFWRSRCSLKGLSARSVLFGVFQSVIVFLYILDNDTNMVVIISVFISLLIDCWKVTKVVVFTVGYIVVLLLCDSWIGRIPS